MTLTAPIPIQAPPRHPPITVQARIPDTVNGLSWRHVLTQTQGLLELAILRNLAPSPWSILDGDTVWGLAPSPGGTMTLTGVWTQR